MTRWAPDPTFFPARPDAVAVEVSRFVPNGDDFRGRRVHQARLPGGDASSYSSGFP